MTTAKQTAINNITRFRIAIKANPNNTQLVKTLQEQIRLLELKWNLGSTKSKTVDVITPFETVRPAYRNNKYQVEKYAKVDPKKADALGRFYRKSEKTNQRPRRKNNTISTWVAPRV